MGHAQSAPLRAENIMFFGCSFVVSSLGGLRSVACCPSPDPIRLLPLKGEVKGRNGEGEEDYKDLQAVIKLARFLKYNLEMRIIRGDVKLVLLVMPWATVVAVKRGSR